MGRLLHGFGGETRFRTLQHQLHPLVEPQLRIGQVILSEPHQPPLDFTLSQFSDPVSSMERNGVGDGGRRRNRQPTDQTGNSLVLSNIPLFNLIIILVKPINPLLCLSTHFIPPLLILRIPLLDLLLLFRTPCFNRFSIFSIFFCCREDIVECRSG